MLKTTPGETSVEPQRPPPLGWFKQGCLDHRSEIQREKKQNVAITTRLIASPTRFATRLAIQFPIDPCNGETRAANTFSGCPPSIAGSIARTIRSIDLMTLGPPFSWNKEEKNDEFSGAASVLNLHFRGRIIDIRRRPMKRRAWVVSFRPTNGFLDCVRGNVPWRIAGRTRLQFGRAKTC